MVIEFTSRGTYREDNEKKFRIYEQVWRTSEYFQFDPFGDYLNPPLRGYHLVNGVYAPLPLIGNRIVSTRLGLELAWEGPNLRFFDPVKQKWLGSVYETILEAEAAERVAEAEAKARVEAEAEIERLRAEIAALKRQNG